MHKIYTRCKSSHSTNRLVCTSHNSVMQNGVHTGMFVFHQFLFINQTYLNGLLGYFHRSCNLVHGQFWNLFLFHKIYRCIRFTQDASHHIVQIDLSVQVTTVSCKTGSILVCLFSTNFSLLIKHTSKDF